MIELLPIVLPELKDTFERSSNSEAEDGSAAIARKAVEYAILAAHQLRWFVTQVCVLLQKLELYSALLWKNLTFCSNILFLIG